MFKKFTSLLSLALLSGAMLLTFFGSSACGGGGGGGGGGLDASQQLVIYTQYIAAVEQQRSVYTSLPLVPYLP